MAKLPPIHPGEILGEEFLSPMQISQSRLARDINVPPRRIDEISVIGASYWAKLVETTLPRGG